MKAAILGDTHFGVKDGSKVFNNFFEKFYTKVFFPYLIQNNINVIIQLGDSFDDRKHAHLKGFEDCKKFFFDKIREYNFQYYSIIGNHDSFYKDTISVNTPKILLNEYSNFSIIETPKHLEIFPGIDCLFIPWICRENYKDCIDEIKNSKSSFCFGHLELKDFSMYKGIKCEEGMDATIFDRFEFVMTGHYHHKSNKGNIYYLGTPYELTWHDESDPKGFHIFDFKHRSLSFIPNPYKIYNKIYYDDFDSVLEDEIRQKIENNLLNEYTESYIKLIVKNKKNPYLFDLFLDSIYKIDPLDVTIIEDSTEILEEEMDDVDDSEDTLTILFKYVDGIKTKDLNPKRLKLILGDLYNEASSLDVL